MTEQMKIYSEECLCPSSESQWGLKQHAIQPIDFHCMDHFHNYFMVPLWPFLKVESFSLHSLELHGKERQAQPSEFLLLCLTVDAKMIKWIYIFVYTIFSNEKGCLMLIKLADLWWQTFTTTPSTLFRSPACHEPWEGCTAFSLFFCMFTSYWKLNYESLLGNTSSPALKPEFSQTIFTAKNKHRWIIEHIWRSCLL